MNVYLIYTENSEKTLENENCLFSNNFSKYAGHHVQALDVCQHNWIHVHKEASVGFICTVESLRQFNNNQN